MAESTGSVGQKNGKCDKEKGGQSMEIRNWQMEGGGINERRRVKNGEMRRRCAF